VQLYHTNTTGWRAAPCYKFSGLTIPHPVPTRATMAISFGKVEITPSSSYPLGGYAVESPRMSNGFREPLFARCIVFWDNGTPNVIVTADILAFPRSMYQHISNQVAQFGVGLSNFVLTSTHTHNGPVVVDDLDPWVAYNIYPSHMGPITQYSSVLVDNIVQLVFNTLTKPPTACTLDYQHTDATFSYNREGLDYVERDVPMLIARSKSEQPLAILFSYGTHPVAQGVLDQFDPDYPGASISWIEELTGAFAQFILGPAGDQNPDLNIGDCDELGASLGQKVATAAGQVGRTVTGPILTSLQEINLPLDITMTESNLAAVSAAYVARLSSGLDGYYKRHARKMICQIDQRSFKTQIPLPLQVWRFSGQPDLRIAFTGGEVVSGYAVYFRLRYGGSDAFWMAPYANEVPAYIPSNELLDYRSRPYSYAGGWCNDYPGIAGGSMTIYPHLGHFHAWTADSVERIFIDALASQLGTPESDLDR
jgi:neutral ceramidase